MVTVTISPFGSMRDFFAQSISLPLSEATVQQLRLTLIGRFPETKDIMDLCVFSDNERIFSEDDLLLDGANIFILPPVCGG